MGQNKDIFYQTDSRREYDRLRQGIVCLIPDGEHLYRTNVEVYNSVNLFANQMLSILEEGFFHDSRDDGNPTGNDVSTEEGV